MGRMKMQNKNHENNKSRRKFIQQSAIAETGLILTQPVDIYSKTTNEEIMSKNIKSKGYAAKDPSGELSF